MAIKPQRFEIDIAMLSQIHFHAVDDFQQLFGRQIELLDDRRQCLAHWVMRFSPIQVSHLSTPPSQLGMGHIGVGTLVGNVVHFAAEGIQRNNGAALGGRQEHEAIVKAGTAGGGFVLAVLVGIQGGVLFGAHGAVKHVEPVSGIQQRALGVDIAAGSMQFLQNGGTAHDNHA